MKLPLLALAAAGSLGLMLATPEEAQAAKVNVDIHFGLPIVPYIVHPPRVIYAPAAVYRAPHYYRHPRPHYHVHHYYRHRGYAGDQWDHGYYDQRRGAPDKRRDGGYR